MHPDSDSKVLVHPHPCPPPSRGREAIENSPSKRRKSIKNSPSRGRASIENSPSRERKSNGFAEYSPSTGGRGLGGGGAELLQNETGMALVVTLLVTVLITAMVVEFSYGIFTSTNSLYNWRDSQRLSLMAKSGINVSAKLLSETLNKQDFSYPGIIELPVENPFEDFSGTIMVRIEDENSKFNVNSVVSSGGLLNEKAYESFKRLLRILWIDQDFADRVADWIDRDRESRISDSEENAKNSPLLSTDELLLIKGMSQENYDKLVPYVTVYGNGLININGAEKVVLRSLSEEITDELAQRVIDYRQFTPFKGRSDIVRVEGFGTVIGPSIMERIDVKGANFYVRSTASSSGVKRIIETVLDMSSSGGMVRYWKEY
ncbi:MAG: type II secretion system minor pseudopilin GspK [Nitrospirota bacterium]